MLRKNYFQTVVMHWNRLSSKVLNSASLELFKERVAVVLGDLVSGNGGDGLADGLYLRGSFQSR